MIRRTAPRLPWLLAMLAILGCDRPPARPPGGRADEIVNVLAWALGSGERDPQPDPVDPLLLLVDPRGRRDAAARTVVTVAPTGAASLLPAPPGDPRIFFSGSGRLYVRADGA